MTQITINKFDIESLQKQTCTLILSDERHLIAENLFTKLLDHNYSTHDVCVVFSPFIGYNDHKKIIRHDHYTPEILEGIFSCQSLVHDAHNISLMFDDDQFTSHLMNTDQNITNLIINGRHYNITTVFKMSYNCVNGTITNTHFRPSIRTYIDHVIMFPYCESISRTLHQQFFWETSVEIYNSVCNVIRKNHGALVHTFDHPLLYL